MTQNDSFDDPKSRIEIPRPNPAETDFGPHMSQNQFLREGFVRDFQWRAPSLAMQDIDIISMQQYATMVAGRRRRPTPLCRSLDNNDNIIIVVIDSSVRISLYPICNRNHGRWSPCRRRPPAHPSRTLEPASSLSLPIFSRQRYTIKYTRKCLSQTNHHR